MIYLCMYCHLPILHTVVGTHYAHPVQAERGEFCQIHIHIYIRSALSGVVCYVQYMNLILGVAETLSYAGSQDQVLSNILTTVVQ
jgi:hypothetical protein